MQVTSHLLVVAAIAAVISMPAGQAQDVSLKECQRIQDKIDYYTEKKKKGGSAKQMNLWHIEREKYRDQFRDYHCRKYGKQIK